MTEDEMVGWQHQFNGLEFEQTRGDSEGLPKATAAVSFDLQRVLFFFNF